MACPNQPVISICVRARAVDHGKFKTAKIYSQGILVKYTNLHPRKISHYTVLFMAAILICCHHAGILIITRKKNH